MSCTVTELKLLYLPLTGFTQKVIISNAKLIIQFNYLLCEITESSDLLIQS